MNNIKLHVNWLMFNTSNMLDNIATLITRIRKQAIHLENVWYTLAKGADRVHREILLSTYIDRRYVYY